MNNKKRYYRQTLLIGEEAQEKILNSLVCIIGLGGTGSAVSEILARAGVNLTTIDNDIVDESNLYRQLSYTEEDLGKTKTRALENYLKKINKNMIIGSHKKVFERTNAEEIVKSADMVVDATDNIATRFLINDVCLKFKKPWIYAGVAGQKAMFMPISPEGAPCLRCLLPRASVQKVEIENPCDIEGVLASLPATLGGMVATETIRIITGDAKFGILYNYNGLIHNLEKTQVKPNKDCGACVKKEFKVLETGEY